jgi:hypothetical protein
MSRLTEGDVLVSKTTARADRYAIRVIPYAAQAVERCFDDAIGAATELARRQAVNGWYTCDHTHFLLVAAYRPSARAIGRVQREETTDVEGRDSSGDWVRLRGHGRMESSKDAIAVRGPDRRSGMRGRAPQSRHAHPGGAGASHPDDTTSLTMGSRPQGS